MRQGLSINYLAYCLLKWKKVLVGAIIFALLLGGFQAFQQVKSMRVSRANEASMQGAMEIYQAQVAEIDSEIAEKQRYLDGINEYLEKSLIMKVNPYQEYVTIIDLAIDLDLTEDYQMKVKYDVSPEEYMLQRVQGLYTTLWSSTDAAELPFISDMGTEDKYIKEIVAVMNKANGVIEIYALSDSPELSEGIAESVCEYLLSQKKVVEGNSYQHKISEFARTTRKASDVSLIDVQNTQYVLADSYIEGIKELQISKAQLVNPNNAIAHISMVSRVLKVLIFALAGAVFGVVLACGCLIIHCVRSNVLMGYYELADSCDLVFLGADLSKGKLFDIFAYKLSRQRNWATKEKALEFIGESVKSRMDRNDIILISSCMLEESKTVEVIDAMKKKGINAKFIEDALHNEKLFAEIEKENEIVLLEKYGESNMEEILEVVNLLQDRDKEVKGFILV